MPEERRNDTEEGLLPQLLALLDTACHASLKLLEYIGQEAEMRQLLNGLRDIIKIAFSVQQSLSERLKYAYTAEQLENIECTLDEIDQAMRVKDYERAAVKIEFQLFPFFRQLREAFYFWGMVYPDKGRTAAYYAEEFASNYQNLYALTDDAPPCRLSIVVTAYNHLETTKQCIQQLLKVTDFKALNAELILIDHGSTDGTLEYFESLKIGKVIHFQKNVRMYMFSALFQMCRGKYFAFISNDILVTQNWAEILLKCLDTDSKIIAVVPETPNIANYQMIPVPTNDPQEFIAWANTHNASNPALWSDRARLMPPLGMYRTAAVNKIGFADPYFYSMEFWDDDFSLRARRAGYRQIVCGDVACYHFGSVTGKEAQIKENTLEYGRDLFRQKNGIDAWEIGFCYDYRIVHLLARDSSDNEAHSLLGLDCGMGDTPLQFRNVLRRQGQSCSLHQLTSQREYLPDLQPFSEEAYYAPQLTDGLREHYGTRSFSCAVLGRGIEAYEDPSSLLEAVSARLIPGGCFVFFCENPFYVFTLNALLQFELPGKMERFSLVDPGKIVETAKNYFSQVKPFGVEKNVEGLEAFTERYFGKSEQILERLKTERYYIVCNK